MPSTDVIAYKGKEKREERIGEKRKRDREIGTPCEAPALRFCLSEATHLPIILISNTIPQIQWRT